MLFLYALFDEQEKAAEKVKIYVGVDEELDYFGKAEGIAFIRQLLETEGFCYDITHVIKKRNTCIKKCNNRQS